MKPPPILVVVLSALAAHIPAAAIAAETMEDLLIKHVDRLDKRLRAVEEGQNKLKDQVAALQKENKELERLLQSRNITNSGKATPNLPAADNSKTEVYDSIKSALLSLPGIYDGRGRFINQSI